MKMYSIFYLSLVLFIPNNGLAGSKPVPEQECRPFNILFIWHVDVDYNTFVQQRRFIMFFIKQLPVNTGIYITTTSASFKMLDFKKDNSNSSWSDLVGSITHSEFENHTVLSSVVSKSVYSFMNKIGKQEVAEEICFVVNDKIRLSSKEMLVNILQYKLTYTIFTGDAGVSKNMWTDLSSSNRHIFILDDSFNENVKTLADAVKSLCCQDSQLVCDTDEYWTGRRCYKCSNICSLGSQNSYSICVENCPYFHKHFPAGKNCEVDLKEINDHCITRGDLYLAFFLQSFLCVVVVILTYGVYEFVAWIKTRSRISTSERMHSTSSKENDESAPHTLKTNPSAVRRRQSSFSLRAKNSSDVVAKSINDKKPAPGLSVQVFQ